VTSNVWAGGFGGLFGAFTGFEGFGGANTGFKRLGRSVGPVSNAATSGGV